MKDGQNCKSCYFYERVTGSDGTVHELCCESPPEYIAKANAWMHRRTVGETCWCGKWRAA